MRGENSKVEMASEKRKVYGWIVTWTIFGAGITLAWTQNKVVPLVTTIVRIYEVSGSMAGWLSSIFSLMAVITAVPSALILRKIGHRVCGLIALGCAAFGAVMGFLVDSFGLLMISRIIEGIGVGMFSVVGPSVISMWFPSEAQSLPMGLWSSWQMVGQSAVFFCAVPVTAWLGWKGMWSLGVFICAVFFVCFYFLVKVPSVCQEQTDEENAGIWKGLLSGKVWLFGAAGFLFSCSSFGWVTWTAPVWSGMFVLREETVHLYLAYLFVLEIPMVIFIGWIYSKYYQYRKLLGFLGSLLYAVMLFLGYHLPSEILLIPFIILYPFLEGMTAVYLWAAMPQMVSRVSDVALALAVLTLCMNLGTVIGPPVVGAIRDFSGYSAAAAVMAVWMGLGAVVLWLVKTPSRQ